MPSTNGQETESKTTSVQELLSKNSGIGKKKKWWIPVIIIVLVLAVIGALLVWSHQRSGQTGQEQGKADSVTIGLQLAPTNLDIRTQSGSSLDQLLIGNVYEGLVSRTSANKIQPGLARSWTISQDGKTYTFHLNKKMKFSNGHVLDSSDVVWSIRSMMKGKYQGYSLLSNYQSVSAPNPQTVVIKLKAPYSLLLWNLSGRAGLVFDKDASYQPKIQAVGSGPYLVSSYKPGTSVTLKANKKYWGSRRAKTSTVRIRYYADVNAGYNALKSGQVDVLAPLDDKLAPSVSADSRFTVSVGDDTDKYVLAFNNKKAPLTNKKVRQAIRYAIDHEAIIKSRGNYDLPLGGPITKLDPGHQDLTGLYPHNLTQARKLMKEAGYGKDKKITLSLEYATIYPAQIGDQLKSQLSQIGINLTVNRVDFNTWLTDVYQKRAYDLSLVDHNESHDFYQWANPDYYYGYNNPRVQTLYKQALASKSDSERDSKLAQAAKIVSQDAAADWLFNYRVVTASRKEVSGFPITLNQSYLPLWNLTASRQ